MTDTRELLCELRPCPFCGSDAAERTDGPYFLVYCRKCGAEQSSELRRVSRSAWNRRATEADLRAEVERLRGLSKAAQDVMAERQRQINVEGWSPEHDDQYVHDDLPRAAACYALSAAGYRGDDRAQVRFWPWLDSWWKPTTPRRDLVKAGALILAEIERLDRIGEQNAG